MKAFDFTGKGGKGAFYKQLKALVVDDFDNFRINVCHMMQRFGIGQVNDVSTAEAALERCEGTAYDVILCDYNLGVGKNGQQLLDELRDKKLLKSSSLFILVSGESSKSVIMAAYDARPDAYLTKPLNQQGLNQRLESLLAEKHDLLPVFQAIDNSDLKKAIAHCSAIAQEKKQHRVACQKIQLELLFDLGDYKTVESICRKFLERTNLEWAKLGLVRALLHREEYDEVITLCDEIIAENAICMQAFDLKIKALEGKDDKTELQKVLKMAVELSPLTYERQGALGSIALQNNDIEIAAIAFQKASRLGEHSHLDTTETQLNFGRCAADMAKLDKQKSRNMAKEAVKFVEQAASATEGILDKDIQRQLVQGQLQFCSGHQQKGQATVATAEQRITEAGDSIALETMTDLVKAFSGTGQEDKAEALFEKLIEDNKNNEDNLKKLDFLSEKPVSKESNVRFTECNNEGIAAFEAKDYDKARRLFEEARSLCPKHTAVALNLAQVLLGAIEDNGYSEEFMASTKRALLAGRDLEESDPQYERYKALVDKYQWQIRNKK